MQHSKIYSHSLQMMVITFNEKNVLLIIQIIMCMYLPPCLVSYVATKSIKRDFLKETVKVILWSKAVNNCTFQSNLLQVIVVAYLVSAQCSRSKNRIGKRRQQNIYKNQVTWNNEIQENNNLGNKWNNSVI